MNKKINYLAGLPLYGSIIVLLWLFIKLIKKEINRKKFTIYFYSCGFMGGVFIGLVILILNLINSLVDINNFINSYGLLVAFIVGGYILNLYTFILINKKWTDLEKL